LQRKKTHSFKKKNEVKNLKGDLKNFVKSTYTFQNIVGSQSGMIDKSCIGWHI